VGLCDAWLPLGASDTFDISSVVSKVSASFKKKLNLSGKDA
jgi:hypothetical protein